MSRETVVSVVLEALADFSPEDSQNYLRDQEGCFLDVTAREVSSEEVDLKKAWVEAISAGRFLTLASSPSKNMSLGESLAVGAFFKGLAIKQTAEVRRLSAELETLKEKVS